MNLLIVLMLVFKITFSDPCVPESTISISVFDGKLGAFLQNPVEVGSLPEVCYEPWTMCFGKYGCVDFARRPSGILQLFVSSPNQPVPYRSPYSSTIL